MERGCEGERERRPTTMEKKKRREKAPKALVCTKVKTVPLI